MRRSISIMAVTAMAVSPVASMGGDVGRSSTTSNAVSSAGNDDGDLKVRRKYILALHHDSIFRIMRPFS
jgi:hypothetical protein